MKKHDYAHSREEKILPVGSVRVTREHALGAGVRQGAHFFKEILLWGLTFTGREL